LEAAVSVSATRWVAATGAAGLDERREAATLHHLADQAAIDRIVTGASCHRAVLDRVVDQLATAGCRQLATAGCCLLASPQCAPLNNATGTVELLLPGGVHGIANVERR